MSMMVGLRRLPVGWREEARAIMIEQLVVTVQAHTQIIERVEVVGHRVVRWGVRWGMN